MKKEILRKTIEITVEASMPAHKLRPGDIVMLSGHSYAFQTVEKVEFTKDDPDGIEYVTVRLFRPYATCGAFTGNQCITYTGHSYMTLYHTAQETREYDVVELSTDDDVVTERALETDEYYVIHQEESDRDKKSTKMDVVYATTDWAHASRRYEDHAIRSHAGLLQGVLRRVTLKHVRLGVAHVIKEYNPDGPIGLPPRTLYRFDEYGKPVPKIH